MFSFPEFFPLRLSLHFELSAEEKENRTEYSMVKCSNFRGCHKQPRFWEILSLYLLMLFCIAFSNFKRIKIYRKHPEQSFTETAPEGISTSFDGEKAGLLPNSFR